MIPVRRWSAGLAVLLLATSVAACGSSTEPEEVTVQATVEFLQVEGGCWSLLASDGTRYEPIDLPESFRQDGLEVEATLELINDVGSVCQVGRIVEIEDIRIRG